MEPELSENRLETLYSEALHLLKSLIQTPSFSREEDKTADIIGCFLSEKGVHFSRKGNNIWAKNRFFDPGKPTILLNSHHDTVKPNKNYTHDPFQAFEKDGKLFGLGSNDAGGALVSLTAVFLCFYDRKNLKYNLILSATAEEEISGDQGVVSILENLEPVDFAVVGEPTLMQLAIAEKALLVVDCTARGTPSHAAHPNEDNAIYKAVKDIQWVESYVFPKVSKWLGKVKMTTTVIHAGELHNQVPAICNFTIDVRVTDQYSTEEVYKTIQDNLKSEVKARSLQRDSSSLPEDHPFVVAGKSLGRTCYGSPTSSDQALIPYPSIKIGPGDSTRSHTADEFIYLKEIKEGIALYIKIFTQLL